MKTIMSWPIVPYRDYDRKERILGVLDGFLIIKNGEVCRVRPLGKSIMTNDNSLHNIQIRGEVVTVKSVYNGKDVSYMFRERSSNYIFESKAHVMNVFTSNTINPQNSFDFDVEGVELDVENEELMVALIRGFEKTWVKDLALGKGIQKIQLVCKSLKKDIQVKNFE